MAAQVAAFGNSLELTSRPHLTSAEVPEAFANGYALAEVLHRVGALSDGASFPASFVDSDVDDSSVAALRNWKAVVPGLKRLRVACPSKTTRDVLTQVSGAAVELLLLVKQSVDRGSYDAPSWARSGGGRSGHKTTRQAQIAPDAGNGDAASDPSSARHSGTRAAPALSIDAQSERRFVEEMLLAPTEREKADLALVRHFRQDEVRDEVAAQERDVLAQRRRRDAAQARHSSIVAARARDRAMKGEVTVGIVERWHATQRVKQQRERKELGLELTQAEIVRRRREIVSLRAQRDTAASLATFEVNVKQFVKFEKTDEEDAAGELGSLIGPLVRNSKGVADFKKESAVQRKKRVVLQYQKAQRKTKLEVQEYTDGLRTRAIQMREASAANARGQIEADASLRKRREHAAIATEMHTQLAGIEAEARIERNAARQRWVARAAPTPAPAAATGRCDDAAATSAPAPSTASQAAAPSTMPQLPLRALSPKARRARAARAAAFRVESTAAVLDIVEGILLVAEAEFAVVEAAKLALLLAAQPARKKMKRVFRRVSALTSGVVAKRRRSVAKLEPAEVTAASLKIAARQRRELISRCFDEGAVRVRRREAARAARFDPEVRLAVTLNAALRDDYREGREWSLSTDAERIATPTSSPPRSPLRASPSAEIDLEWLNLQPMVSPPALLSPTSPSLANDDVLSPLLVDGALSPAPSQEEVDALEFDCEGVAQNSASFLQVLSEWTLDESPLAGPIGCIVAYPPAPGHNRSHTHYLAEKFSLVEISATTVIADALAFVADSVARDGGGGAVSEVQRIVAIEPAYGASLTELARAVAELKGSASDGALLFDRVCETPALMHAIAARVAIAEVEARNYIHIKAQRAQDKGMTEELDMDSVAVAAHLSAEDAVAQSIEESRRRCGWVWNVGPRSAEQGAIFDATISRALNEGVLLVGDGTSSVPVGEAVAEALRMRKGQLIDITLWEEVADVYTNEEGDAVWLIDPLTGAFTVREDGGESETGVASNGAGSDNDDAKGSSPLADSTAAGHDSESSVAALAVALASARESPVEITREMWNTNLVAWSAHRDELQAWHSHPRTTSTSVADDDEDAAEPLHRWLFAVAKPLPLVPPDDADVEEEDMMALIDERVRLKLIDEFGKNMCPDVTVILAHRQIKLHRRLNFAANKAEPSEPKIFEDMMSQIGKAIIVATDVTMEFGLVPVHLMVGGHADVPAKNAAKPSIMSLTTARANRVVDELEGRGVIGLYRSVIHFQGYGGTRPLPGVTVGEGDRPNMRVEFNVVDLEDVDPEAARIERERAAAIQEKARRRKERLAEKRRQEAEKEKKRHELRVLVERMRTRAESETLIIEACARSVVWLKEEEDRVERNFDLQIHQTAIIKEKKKKKKKKKNKRSRRGSVSPRQGLASPTQSETLEPHSYVSNEEYRDALGCVAAAHMRRDTLDNVTASIIHDRVRVATSQKVMQMLARLPDSRMVREKYAAAVLQHAFFLFIAVKHVEKQGRFLAASPSTAPWACGARRLWVFWEDIRRSYEFELDAALDVTQLSWKNIVEHHSALEPRFNEIVYRPSGFRDCVQTVLGESAAKLSALGVEVEISSSETEVEREKRDKKTPVDPSVGLNRRIDAVRGLRHTLEDALWSSVCARMDEASAFIGNEFGVGESGTKYCAHFASRITSLVESLEIVVAAEQKRIAQVPILFAGLCEVNTNAGALDDPSLRGYPPFDDAGRFKIFRDEMAAALDVRAVHPSVWALFLPVRDMIALVLGELAGVLDELLAEGDDLKMRQARLLCIEGRCLVRRLRAVCVSSARGASKIYEQREPLHRTFDARLATYVATSDRQAREALVPLRAYESTKSNAKQVLLSLPCEQLLRARAPTLFASVTRETVASLVDAFRAAVDRGFGLSSDNNIRGSFDPESTFPQPKTLLPWRYFVAALAHGWPSVGEWILSASAGSSAETILRKDLCGRLDPLCAVDGNVDWVDFVNALLLSAGHVEVPSISELCSLRDAYNAITARKLSPLPASSTYQQLKVLSAAQFTSVALPFAGDHSEWCVQLQLQMLGVGAQVSLRKPRTTFSSKCVSSPLHLHASRRSRASRHLFSPHSRTHSLSFRCRPELSNVETTDAAYGLGAQIDPMEVHSFVRFNAGTPPLLHTRTHTHTHTSPRVFPPPFLHCRSCCASLRVRRRRRAHSRLRCTARRACCERFRSSARR